MLVSELIKTLKTIQAKAGNVRIVVRGYEDGVDDLNEAEIVFIIVDEHINISCYGDHKVICKSDICDMKDVIDMINTVKIEPAIWLKF